MAEAAPPKENISASEDSDEENVPLDGNKKVFTKELRDMMYGFGDDVTPYAESVDAMEDLVVDFITNMCGKAMDIGKKGKIEVSDMLFLIRKDPKKFSRAKEILIASGQLEQARKAFNVQQYDN